ncbi:MAG: efflux RND transporter periplasmic adaptor subunit [Pseudomonadota bacterium]|nr:efflux RND transporter periplasmic adaptor subunit [Pseudomonadota bacterium]
MEPPALKSGLVLLAAVLCLGTGGCRENPQPTPEVVRAVKTVTVSEVARGQVRRFSGVVHATETADLSFQVGGKILEIPVELGDRVEKDQRLARLDPEAYNLQLARAEADRDRAQAELRDSQENHERFRQLFQRRTVSKAELDSAQARHEAARNAVELAKAQVELARRDIRHTDLKAPFAGVIASQLMDAFTDVKAGQTVLQLEGEGEMEVELLIPETLIGQVSAGQTVDIDLPLPILQGRTLAGSVSRVGSRADEANAYPVEVQINDPPPEVRPGMTAEVTFTFRNADDAIAYLLPLTALLPPADGPPRLGPRHRDATVFVFDPQTSTVRRRPVRVRNIRDNMVEVVEGAAPGDIVVVAGVHHLHDGQQTRLLEPLAALAP